MGTVCLLCHDLCLALSKLADVPAESLVVTDVYNHRFFKIYTGEDQISKILDRDDIFVYQMDISNPDLVTVPVYTREFANNMFGQPLMVSLPKSCTVMELYSALLVRMSRYVTRPQPGHEWWTQGSSVKSPIKMFSFGFVDRYGNVQPEHIDFTGRLSVVIGDYVLYLL